MDAIERIRPHLRPGQLVILESTTYPGTTDEVILPALEKGGLKVGRDFFLAFSPERVDPGNPSYKTDNTPKVVGGYSPACCAVSEALYKGALPYVHVVSSAEAAEMVKLLENTFRAVNIGLVNEFALMCDKLGLDVWEVIDAAATKPFGFMPFYPGPGLGGHCIPIDPHYLSWKLKIPQLLTRFIELAGEINRGDAGYVVSKLGLVLNDAGQGDQGDARSWCSASPTRGTSTTCASRRRSTSSSSSRRAARRSRSTTPTSTSTRSAGRRCRLPLTPEALRSQDVVLIVTDHSSVDYDEVVRHSKLVFDTRNATKRVTGERAKVVTL